MKHSARRRMSNPLPAPRPYVGPLAIRARVDRRRLVVELKDRRTLVFPLALIPGFDRLPSRAFVNPTLVGGGIAIYFEAIDECVGVENLFHPELTMIPKILPRLVDRRPKPVHARRG
jgi:hypothetical protein